MGMNEVRVYGHFVAKPGVRVAHSCREFDVDPQQPVLLVMATRHGPRALAEAVAAAGERPLSVNAQGRIDGIVDLRANNLTAFARAHPEQLLATAATGHPAVRNSDGSRTTVWADLTHAVHAAADTAPQRAVS